MTAGPNHPSRDDRIRDIVVEFRQMLASGLPYDRDEFVARQGDLSEEIRPILKAIEATEPFIAKEQNNQVIIDHQSSSPSNATINWSSDSSRESSNSDLTQTHVTGSGSSQSMRNRSAASRMLIGTTVADYQLLRPLGSGGMGEVFEAEELNTNRRFAVKILSSTLPRTKETVERFLNEASLAASLSHPRTTFVYGAGQDNGQFFIAMELMPGHTLKDLVEEEGPRPVSEAVDFVLDILDGLEAAHAVGVIHRDLKPSNCFLDTNDRVKVGDFGLAKSLVAGTDITQTGTFLGTPQFAAPEQIRHDQVDRRTDIFAVGATLYYLLSGQAPFTGDPAAVIAKIVADTPPNVRTLNPDVPKTLARIINRCMNKSPNRRFHSASELRRLLLPFSTEGTSMADVGRRMASFMTDILASSAFTVFIGFLFLMVKLAMQIAGSPYVIRPMFSFFTYVSIFSIFYFSFFEGLWGRSLGKYFLGIRIVDSYGESPGLWRGLVRALVFPGLFLTSVDILGSSVHQSKWFQEFMEVALPLDIMRNFVEYEAFLAVKVFLTIACFSTMRRKNGYRGLHELASDTRVVRTRMETPRSIFRRLATVWGVSRQREGLPATLGPYRVMGEIGGSDRVNVLEGHDEALTRSIWLYCASKSMESGNEVRSAVNRPTRQRWLHHGVDEDIHWQAVEAIDGGPVLALIDNTGSIPWEAGRELLPDLADEMVAALDDGTLPEQLSLDQLWLDRNGGLRLLDFPLWTQQPFAETSELFAGEAPPPSADNVGRAWHLYREVASRCQLDIESPGGAVDELEEIIQKPTTKEALKASAKALRAFSDVPYSLSWDSRLGMTAVAVVVEASLLSTWSFIVAWWVTGIVRYDFWLSMGIGILFASAMPALLGFAFHGGLVFSLSEFETRKLSDRKQNRVRSAVRSVIAWLPLIVPIMAYRVISFMSTEQAEMYVKTSSEAFIWVVITGVLLSTACLVLAGIGVLFSIISEPRRGLPDLIAGTYLVTK